MFHPKKTFAAVSLCFQTCFDDDDDDGETTTTMMTTLSFPQGGECRDANPNRAVSSTPQRAVARCAGTSGNTNTNAITTPTTNARKPASSSSSSSSSSLRYESVFRRRRSSKGRWKCNLERRRHHRHRRIIDRAFRGSDDDTRLVVHEESRFGAVLRRARVDASESPELDKG